MTTPKYRLVHTNAYKERHYFVSLGREWPHNPAFRLIERTSPRVEDAVLFDTIVEALAVITAAGDPQGWADEVVSD